MLRKFFEKYLLHYLFCGFCLLTVEVNAQVLDSRGVLNLDYLKYTNEVPKELLTTRTVVLIEDEINIPVKKASKSLPWQGFAERVHPTLRMLAIDPVAYYNLDLLLSGASVTSSFSNDIKSREIKHAIVLKRQLSSSNDTAFSLILASLSEEAEFFEAGQQAFQIQHTNLDALLQQLVRAVSGAGLNKSNFLILEKPEFFNKTQIFTSGRFENFNPDLKLDKLAVPLFEEKPVPASIPEGMSKSEVTHKVNSENVQVKAANERLVSLMKTYPFSSGPVSFKDGDAVWKKDGNHFILFSIHGKAEVVREMLQYENVEDQATYTTTRIVDGEPVTKEIDKNREVYKYYIKHLNSGEIYLGTHWDADTSWDQALENFILNLKASFKI